MKSPSRVLALRPTWCSRLLLLCVLFTPFAAPHAALAQCTADTCTTCTRPALGANDDGDGIPDTLEYDLAHRFFPSVIMRSSTVDFGETYFYAGKAAPYLVKAYQGAANGICGEAYQCLEVRFGLPYFYDHGDQGFPGHLGDSEFYAILVRRTSSWPVAQGDVSQWQIIRDFTASHWGAGLADSSRYGAYGYCPESCSRWNNDEIRCSQTFGCSNMPGQCMGGMSSSGPNYYPCNSYSDGFSCSAAGCQWQPAQCVQSLFCYSGSPLTTPMTLYASEKKHGTYHSDAECDAGGFSLGIGGADECPNDYPVNLRDYKGNLLQNIGNVEDHSSDVLIQHPDRCQLYDVWGGLKFGSSSTTEYRYHFTTPLGWMLPPATATSSGCGEATCVPAQGAYISHFTGAGCTGTESYYLPYNGYAYQCRPWNGTGQCGTIRRTVTNRSYRYNGTCYDAWSSGNTLSDFVTVYR